MKRRIIFWLLAGFFMASCHKDPVQPPLPEISIDKSSLEEFSYQAGSSQDVILKVNRDWTIQCSADWLAFDYDAGPVTVGQMKEITVTITPLTNRVGNVRSAVVRFKTSTKYADLHVSQASHPDNAPELIYYNSFGEDLQGLDNPLIQNTDIWRVEEGVAEDFVYFSDANSTKKISVRNSSTSNSSLGAGSDCYMGASGGNHIFFGTQNPYFTLGNIEVHPKLTMIMQASMVAQQSSLETISQGACMLSTGTPASTVGMLRLAM